MPISYYAARANLSSLCQHHPHGKRQHVVETLNIIEMGTSVLLDAHVRSDFTAETALEAVALGRQPPRQ